MACVGRSNRVPWHAGKISFSFRICREYYVPLRLLRDHLNLVFEVVTSRCLSAEQPASVIPANLRIPRIPTPRTMSEEKDGSAYMEHRLASPI